MASMALLADLTLSEAALRLVTAVALAGVLGFEREARQKPAGLRTHMMVSLGAACFTLAALELVASAGVGQHGGHALRVDPIRVVEGVIGGIGFLGAGAIMRQGQDVHGLTTAGSIWLSGALGVAAGIGEVALAAMAVLLAVVVLYLLGLAELRLGSKPPDD